MSSLRSETCADLHGLKYSTFRERFSGRLVSFLHYSGLNSAGNNHEKKTHTQKKFSFSSFHSHDQSSASIISLTLCFIYMLGGVMGETSWQALHPLTFPFPTKQRAWKRLVPPSAFAPPWISLCSEDKFRSMHNLCQSVIATTVKWLHLCLNGFPRAYGIYIYI